MASLTSSRLVPGTQVKLRVRTDAAGELLLEVASAFDRLVEDIDNARGALDDWGYAERPIRGGSTLSNHASGTAMDLNAPKHPLGTDPRANFTAAQISTIHQIVGVTSGVVRWGGDYTGRRDPMHFEVNDGQTVASCQRALESMRQFNARPAQEPEMSDQFEKDARARWPREDLLEKDLRADLAVKQKQINGLVADMAEVRKALEQLLGKDA